MSETLNLCKHGTPVKFGCRDCFFEHSVEASPLFAWSIRVRVDEIDDKLKEHTSLAENNAQHLNERISTVEKYCDEDLGSWDLLEERIEKLECYSNNMASIVHILETDMTHINLIMECKERLDKLENHENDQPHHVLKMHERIDYVLSKINQFDVMKAEKKPHKCPVCYGNGEWELTSIEEVIQNGGSKHLFCKPCEGKGIVWG
jgi:DNA repair exonuclease SbcCD ATPase subunit